MPLPHPLRSTRRTAVGRPRQYRLVEVPGLPHPSLDGLYETAEDAWQDAQHWWQSGEQHRACGGAIGVEVSTLAGEWRTLWLGCPSSLRW